MEPPIAGLGPAFLASRLVPGEAEGDDLIIDVGEEDAETAAIRAELSRAGLPSSPGEALVDHKTNELLVCTGDFGLLRLTGLRVDGRATVSPIQLAAGMRAKKSAKFLVGPDVEGEEEGEEEERGKERGKGMGKEETIRD
jgi:hypothetical protein